MLIELLQSTIWIIAIANAPRITTDATIYVSLQLGFLVIAFILSTTQLLGGIALARQRSLGMARTGAMICCLPCLCILNIPFGIWGCILVFGKEAQRKFK